MKFLYVVPTGERLSAMRAILSDHWDVITLWSNITGYMYDEIWIDADWQKITETVDQVHRGEEQIKELYTALTPHGRMRYVQ